MAKKKRASIKKLATAPLADLVGAMQLVEVCLVSSRCISTVRHSKPPEELTNNMNLSPTYLNNDSVLQFDAKYSLVGEFAQKAKALSEPPLLVEATFVVAYQNPTKKRLSENDLQAFAHLYVMTHAWPYWREFVSSSLGRMGLPLLTLPLWRGSVSDMGPTPKGGPKALVAPATKKTSKRSS